MHDTERRHTPVADILFRVTGIALLVFLLIFQAFAPREIEVHVLVWVAVFSLIVAPAGTRDFPALAKVIRAWRGLNGGSHDTRSSQR